MSGLRSGWTSKGSLVSPANRKSVKDQNTSSFVVLNVWLRVVGI